MWDCLNYEMYTIFQVFIDFINIFVLLYDPKILTEIIRNLMEKLLTYKSFTTDKIYWTWNDSEFSLIINCYFYNK